MNRHATAARRMAAAATAAATDADEQRTAPATPRLFCGECLDPLPTRPRLRRDGRCPACRGRLHPRRRRVQVVDPDLSIWGWR
jgi:hypothetical protein